MTWFPIGPDFVDTPRDLVSAVRLSRRNQWARQGRVIAVAVDPNNVNTIYTVDSVLYPGMPRGGSGAFRTTDGGQLWKSITDSLQLADPSINPTCIAVHPTAGMGNYIVIGTDAGAIYTSSTSGDSWNPPVAVTSSGINQLIIDPRGAPGPTTTTIYASTGNGVFVSTNTGSTWGTIPVLAGAVTSMSFSLLPTAADCYVGLGSQGVYYSNNPTSTASWTPISGTGLPPAGSAGWSFVACCPANPQCAYAYFTTGSTSSIFKTGHGATKWKPIMSPTLLTTSNIFAAAPNSPGNGTSDILFLGDSTVNPFLWRSIDGGATWIQSGDTYHADQRAIVFVPANAPPGAPPTTIIGCDGGLVASSGFADPSFLAFGATPSAFDDQATYSTTSQVAQNLSHGKMSLALHWYAADPSASAIGYVTSDDTGTSGHTSALGWRGLHLGDDGPIACTPGNDGMKVWAAWQYYNQTSLFTDTGQPGDLAGTSLTLGPTPIFSTSNHVLTSDKKCVAGVNNPSSSTPLNCVVIIDQSGVVTQISQSFARPPVAVATSTTDPQLLVCCTSDNRVWLTQGVTPGIGTWNEAATGKPAIPGTSIPLAGDTVISFAIDAANHVYALTRAVPSSSSTPLYAIASGTWTPQTCSGLPAGPFHALVADPITAGTLYAVSLNRVFRLVLSGTTWTWTEVGLGLPGTQVETLWIGNIGTASAPKVLLRAAVALRGVWETDVTLGATDPPSRPYVRDHFLDQGWLVPSPDWLVNPFQPSDGHSVFHYQCADLKIDAQHPGSPPFFQTDPEGTLPLSHVLFDLLNDNPQNLPGSDAAMVHAQVHNRSLTPIDNVSVWAIYAKYSAGVPALSKSPSMGDMFPFWSQFKPSGDIVPNLPSDSPWTAVGPPTKLSAIDAAHPRVASWPWTVPPWPVGNMPGHYCMVVFVHSAENPVGETTNYNVDAITPTNPQIGQKNLLIGPPLAAAGGGLGAGGASRMREYVEFHNATAEERIADLVVDLRTLPPELHMWLRLSELQTVAPLDESLTGIEVIHRPGLVDDTKAALLAGVERGEEILEWLDRWLDRVEEALGGEPDDDAERRPKRRLGPRLAPPIYRAKPASLVSVRGVRLPGYGSAAALLVIENVGTLPPGREYRFQVQQVVRGEVVGGGTFVVRIAGKPELPPVVAPSP